MNTLWNAKDVAQATQGQCAGEWNATRVSIDSRSIEKGDLFVALIGEHFDGHAYVQEALSQGAVAAIVSAVPEGMDGHDPRLVIVEETEEALQLLGEAGRARFSGKMVGVTGSVGKTGCKEMLRTALGAVGSVYATKGNLNNHLGVPLNLANLPADVEYAVMEMGMNHAGEIHLLSHWVKPDVSIITTVEAQHMEFFPSVDAIADAKAEIFDGMGGAGVALLNADNAQFTRLHKHAVDKGLDRTITFGTGDNALCRMVQYRLEGLQSVVDAVIQDTPVQYRMAAIGKHWGLMSVAVLGVIEALGADLAKAAEALEAFDEPQGRGRIEELPVKGGYIRLIDDSYNAGPASMQAAFEKVYALSDVSPEPVRTVAVLGDMLELGERAQDLHVGLVPSLINTHIDLVFAAGSFMKAMYDALPEDMKGAYDLTAADLAPKVVKALRPKDLVLVKGSRGSRMDRVGDAIRKSGSDKD